MNPADVFLPEGAKPVPNSRPRGRYTCEGYYALICYRGPVDEEGLCPSCAAWLENERQQEMDPRKAGW